MSTKLGILTLGVVGFTVFSQGSVLPVPINLLNIDCVILRNGKSLQFRIIEELLKQKQTLNTKKLSLCSHERPSSLELVVSTSKSS